MFIMVVFWQKLVVQSGSILEVRHPNDALNEMYVRPLYTVVLARICKLQMHGGLLCVASRLSVCDYTKNHQIIIH